MYKNIYMYNINIKKIKQYVKNVSCSNIITLNNHNRISITKQLLLDNNYFIQ